MKKPRIATLTNIIYFALTRYDLNPVTREMARAIAKDVKSYIEDDLEGGVWAGTKGLTKSF